MTNRRHIEAGIRFLEDHGNLRDVQDILRRHEAPTGRSWTEIGDHYNEARSDAGLLTDYFEEIALYGQKSFALLEAEPALRVAARNYVGQVEDAPLMPHLLGQPPATPRLVSVRKSDESLVMVYRSRRTFIDKSEITEDWVKPQYQNRIRNADQAVIVESERSIAFDCVEIPFDDDAPVVLRITTRAGGLSSQETFRDMSGTVMDLAAEELGLDSSLVSTLDLFPAVRALYVNDQEGRVVEMHFDCSTGCGRKEKIRVGEVDLRHEVYHRAGVAQTNIMPYRVSIRWEDTTFGRVDLTLPGRRKMLSQDHRPRLTEVKVDRPKNRLGYEYAVQRVLANLA